MAFNVCKNCEWYNCIYICKNCKYNKIKPLLKAIDLKNILKKGYKGASFMVFIVVCKNINELKDAYVDFKFSISNEKDYKISTLNNKTYWVTFHDGNEHNLIHFITDDVDIEKEQKFCKENELVLYLSEFKEMFNVNKYNGV